MAVSELTFTLCFLAPVVQDPNLVTTLALILACYILSFIKSQMEWAANHEESTQNTPRHPGKGTSPGASVILS